MKRIFVPLFFLSLVALLCYISFSRPRPHFVYLKHKQFYLDGKPFFPLVLNYQVTLQSDKNGLWASPYADYLGRNGNLLSTKDSCLSQLKADMELIREMGFNTIRIVGIGEEKVNKSTGELWLKSAVYNREDSAIALNDENYRKYFSALTELLDIVEESGMKAILLTKMVPEIAACDQHLIRLADQFRHAPVLMAYDLFNEPLYFDTLKREKKDVFTITRNWKHQFRKHAPDQLLTIGLVGVREVFEWDPNAVNVDFISFHPYEFEPGQVKNEMYWFSKMVKKPWIIGETGLAADNDSVTYDQQKKFAETTLKYCVDAGGVGYSWWQFKDVHWKEYHASYLGLLNQNGTCKTKTGKTVTGTPKPVTEVFRRFQFSPAKTEAKEEPNYFNFSAFKTYRLHGKLVNQLNEPIANGVVMVWGADWNTSFITFTKADGTFELFTNEPVHHTVFSGSIYTVTKGDIKAEDAKPNGDGTFSIDAGTVMLWQVYF